MSLSGKREENVSSIGPKDSKGNPLVSIIIPCFNNGPFVGEAIRSALDQRWRNLEVIIVDDGSTDDSRDKIEAIEDPRITYKFQENAGAASARNTGIQISRGRFISFLDSDDYFIGSKVHQQAGFLQGNAEYGMIVGGFRRVDQDGGELFDHAPEPGEIQLSALVVGNQFPIHSYLIRREWIERVGGFDETLSAAEDWDLHCRLMLCGCRIYRTGDIVCAYRWTRGSLTSTLSQSREMLRVIERTFEDESFPKQLGHLKNRALGDTLLTGAIRAYAIHAEDQAKAYLSAAWDLRPEWKDDNYESVLRKIVDVSRQPEVECRRAFVRQIGSNLPECAAELRPYLQNTLFWFLVRDAWTYWTQRRWTRIAQCLMKILVNHPRQFAHYASTRIIRAIRCIFAPRGAGFGEPDSR